MFTDQRLYRARALEPVASFGDIVFLLDQAGPLKKYKTPYFAVASVRPFVSPTPRNLLLLWSQGATAPAGYGTAPGNTTLIPEAATGNINNGAAVSVANPKILQGGTLQLMQARFTVKPLALTGIVAQDIEVSVKPFGNIGGFGLYNGTPGYFNQSSQMADPADSIVSGAQGANETLPAAYANIDPADNANLHELFWFEQNGPTFTVYNNGSAAVTAGAVGVRIRGFLYDLVELDPSYLTTDRWVYGAVRKAPDIDRPIITLPTAVYSGQPGQQ